ncbi:A/G-specific adenine glycosylase [Buchnera aphidicola]|jgi:A/G-specific adenine glycosylase|uniref:Adenine DNA glycosylase n=1 Tax=Buchnera aphidicola subsp. Schizaphis graminum (strain Sg) TaxID=198804 RepID=MUTY_BUCAP|nr:A/G-specific adenine glycosylase [Buchnera aphidicola]Q8K926.1 RecName: Full=Adenine DNA glycosylase [Buchnera aphidicola str. Sg (Schizaphis graminum)]AAM68075.1 A/G-specific adenine glycosylase [Buchnera aphidicola str. Sg (Schizaphis graminum)]AWI49435.1 A/G-specific adenine glycosylase [Buchnera aphidicola (Schizaphis graminum)]
MTIYVFSQLILNWYHINGRKNLPWKKDKTLYKVWISEIMLQQTTVKTAIPYFKNFISRFPNIQSLNQSKLDDILCLWSGLGYYKRAENIYKTVKIIKEEFQEKFPTGFSDLIKLPGIGRSTAGAILSLSLDYFFPILEGNVKRILMRYYGIIGYVTEKKIEQKLWYLIELITPIHNTGSFNQGIMDIGALICTPKNPKCNLCPLIQKCIAYKEKNWIKYPLKKKKKIILEKKSWFVVIKYQNQFWIEKNTEKKIWKNLFCFPNFDTKIKTIEWLKKNKINIDKKHKKIQSFYHKFSHFTLHIIPILVNLSFFKNFQNSKKTGIWYDLKNTHDIGLPKPVQKILEIFK